MTPIEGIACKNKLRPRDRKTAVSRSIRDARCGSPQSNLEQFHANNGKPRTFAPEVAVGDGL